MKMFFFEFLIALYFTVCIAFKRNCPEPSERELRAIAFCNKSSTVTYSCLYDENRGVNVESCKATVDFAPPGNKYVQRGQPDFTPCARNRYQPIRLWSNVSGQCLFEKSQCAGDGQFLYNNGTTESDRSCRCDYTNGYAFINKPRHPCFCIPSEEECSCYKKYCLNNTVLTPDYDCAQEDDMRGKESTCPIIVYDRLSTDSVSINTYNVFVNRLWNELSPKLIAFIVTTVCTLLIAVEGFLVLICYKGKEKDPFPPNDVCLHTDNNGITVRWSNPSHTPADKISQFKIKWNVNDSEEGSTQNVPGTVNKCVIPDVFPSATYKITVTTCIGEHYENERGGFARESAPSEESEITTKDPEPPRDLKATAGISSINLTWIRPQYPSFAKINKYKIQRISNAQKDIIYSSVDKTSYLMHDVLPSQTYLFTIKTCCGTFENECESKSNAPVKCTAKEPLPPNDLKASISLEGIHITWSVPEYPTIDKIRHFLLEVNGGNTRTINVESNKTFVTISDVFPSTSYTICMATCVRTPNEIQTDEEQSSGIKTKSGYTEMVKCKTQEPLPPNDLKASISLEGIHITWSVPEYPTIDKIHHFLLEVNGGNTRTINVESDKTFVTISDVFPSTSYTICMATCVRTPNEIQTNEEQSSGIKTKSEYTEMVKCKTQEPLPPKDLKALTDFKGIHISWSVPEYPTISKICHFILEVNAGNKEIINVSSDKTSFLISDVFPSTSYSIRMSTSVRTGNEIQTDENQSSGIKTGSEYTDGIQCKTPEPSPPMDVIASPRSNGIMVSWTCPDYPTEDKIQCYKLEMTNLTGKTQTRDIKPNNKGDGSILMSNVSSNTEYSFTIATAAKGPTSLEEICQLPCITESIPSKIVKCVTKVICEETKVKEEKKNFLRLEKLFHMANSAVIQKIEEKISETNLETTHLDTPENVLNSLSKDHQASIYGIRDNCVSTSSINYDLVLLLRFWLSSNEQEVPTIQFDKMPSIDDTSIQADLSRIYLTRKRYQLSPMTTISAIQFDEEWKSVYMAVVRLGGSKFEEKCTRLLRQLSSQISRQMSKANDEKNGNQDIFEAILQEEEKKSSEQHMCSCLDLHKLEVRTWKKCTDNFNIKGVIDDLQKQFEDSSCVALVGTENEEVNAILHHIALAFVECNDRYVITPCKSPVEVVQHYKLDRHQLFVLEDVCGRLFPVQESVHYIIEHDSSFKQMLQAGKTKIMISFTACVYWKTIFSKTNSFFRKYIKDLAPKYSGQFAPQQSVRTVEFEITWREQLDDWFLNDKSKHCALFLTTIHNGCISSLCFKQHEIQPETDLIRPVLEKYSLDCGQVRASLLDHSGNYVLKDGEQYRISNSTMFHFLCCYFCAHKDLQELFLQLVDGKVFYGKLVLECTQEKFGEDFVSVNNLQEERYFSRILDDVSRKDYSVFYSRQMQVPAFRQKLIAQVTKMGGNWIIGMINTKELQEIAITGQFQRSPLLMACSQGYEELVSFMLHHVDKNIKDKTVSALFRITVDQGYPLSVVRLLKRSDVNLNIVWDDSWTALNAACQRGNQDIANFLIDEGSTFDKVDALGTTPLMLACYTGLYETVQLMIKKGVDINVLNNRKMSALKYACISGHKNIVSLLLDNDADSRTVCQDGKTPLVIAFEEKHDHIITLLKNKGFDVENTDKFGKTSLAMACTNGDKDTVKSLIKLGANINSRDNEGWVPLSRACKRGAESIVKVLLIEEILDLNIADNDGWTPLKKASLNGHSKVVEILLNTHRLEIDKADNDGWTPLMSSCQKGHVKVAKLLICGNADVNYRSNDGITPLMTAVKNEHVAVINLLLENNANVDLDDNDGWTPLRVACNDKKYKAADLLLKKRPDVDKPDKKGYTPLKIACKNGHYKISSLLINAGANVNWKDKDGWTPLITACKEGNLKICTLLMSHEADINIPNLSGWTPLKTAAANGHTEIVECLLKKGVILDNHDNDGWTELMSACQFGYEKIAKLLVENGSCVNHQSVKKFTPLFAACQNNMSKVMTFLIKNEANVNVCDVNGWTPLHFTCMRGHIKASEILIRNGANVNKADDKGCTPLKIACKNKNPNLAEILINAKADVNLLDNNGWSPLKTACSVGDKDTVELLLNNNADINKEDKEGWTPLKSASVNGHYQIVKKLLKKKAEINEVDHEGWTSLMSACKVGNFKVISVLLEYEADVNCYSESTGDTPFIIACTYSDGEIIELLLEKGADSKKTNNIGQTALLVACMYGKTKNVSKLLDYRVDTDVTDKNGLSALKAACQGMYIEIVELLIKAGANINIVDGNGYTPLISACETQNHQLVELLIRYKADVNKSTPDGWNPYLIAIKNSDDEIANSLVQNGADQSNASLLKACEIGHLPIIQCLLDQGRCVESKEIGVMTPLKLVIEKRHFFVLDLFIKKGRTFELDRFMLKDLIDEFDEEGLSSLAKACRDANTETLIYLLKHGADIFQADQQGISPLIHACLKGNVQNVDLLLEKVVDVNSKRVIDSCRGYLNKADNNGYTPLTAAASQGHVPLIELLITNGTDVDKFDGLGKSPIMYACEKGDLRTVKALVSNGASMTVVSDRTCSPFKSAKQAKAWDIVDYFIEKRIKLKHEDLMSISTTECGNEKRGENDVFAMACKNGFKALVELIIDEKQADLNSHDCEGLTMLMHACKMNQTKIVEIIVKKGIDIDLPTLDGKTALMFACGEGYTDIAEILLKHHANVNKCDNSGLTSLMMACEKGLLSSIKLLLDHKADMNMKSNIGSSAFEIACHTEHYAKVDYLVSQGSYRPFEYDIRTLLNSTHTNEKELIQRVCKSGYESIFNILIESEDEIDATDGDGNSLLMLASQGGHDGIIENLMKRGANIYHKNQVGQTALGMACNGGLARSVKILLKNHAHPNLADKKDRTPLMIASQNGCLDVVKMLVQHNADINLCDRKGTSALMLSAKQGKFDTAEYLITKGAEASKCDNKGLNSLMAACQNGHIEIVRLIVKTKIDLNSSDNDGFTSLRFACDGGHNDIVDFLIKNKAEVDKADTNCWTPLKSSCKIGKMSTVALLLESKAEVNKQDKDGWTPLMSACQHGHDNIAELLLNFNADIGMTEVDGWTALRIACNNGQASTVKFLVSKGANVNKIDKRGWSPLKDACVGDRKSRLNSILSKKYEEIVACLIQNGADVNLVDEYGWTCLMSACQGGHTDLVNLLLSKVDDIDKVDNKGWTAFIMTCCRGHTNVAELLLNHGADINKADSDGWTPLKIACQVGLKDTVKMLLRNGANVNIEDKDGWTSLMSACKHGNRDIVKSLLETGVVEYYAHDGFTTPIKIARKFGHRHIEKLLERSLEGSISGDEDDEQGDEENIEVSGKKFGRINFPFRLPFSNDSDEDDDDDDSQEDDDDDDSDEDDEDDDSDEDDDDSDEDYDDESIN